MASAKEDAGRAGGGGDDEGAPASPPREAARKKRGRERDRDGAPPSTTPPKTDRYRLIALGVAALFFFPVLAKSGIWDPYELDAADLARRIALRLFGATALEMPGAVNTLPTLTDLKMGELPFTSMAVGFRLFGLHDWTGRLPLALWGFAGVAVLYELLARLIDRRAGLYAAVALVTMPLYFIQARTMLGDVVTMSAMTIAFSGLVGGLLDEERRPAWLAIGALGLVAGYLSRGAIIGVGIPAVSIGLTWLVLKSGAPKSADGSPAQSDLVGVASLLIGVVAVAVGGRALLHATSELPLSRTVGFLIQKRPPLESTFDLVVRQLGHALFPWSAFVPFALGRLFRPPVEAPASARERETGVRLAILLGAAVAYGAFALLAPRSGSLAFSAPALLAAAVGIVVLDFERGAPPSRALALATAVLAAVLFFDIYREQDKALTAFVVERPQFPKTFEASGQRYLKVVLVAFVGFIGLTWIQAQPAPKAASVSSWGRGLVQEYKQLFHELNQVWNGNLVFTMVVIEAALVGTGGMILIGRRVGWAPLEAKLSQNTADVGTNLWWILPAILAALPALVLAVRDGFSAVVGGARLPRASFTMIAALVAGGTLSFGYYPGLAAQLSPKEAFESYSRLARAGEPLALLSVRSRAAAYYSGAEAPAFTDANQAFAWLSQGSDRADKRRWLLLKAEDLQRMNSLYRAQQQKNLPILDGRSSQILLASNELGDHVNENSLAKVVLDEPVHPVHVIDVTFEDQLQGIGWDITDQRGELVDSVVPVTTYHLRTYYRVLRPITGTWKAFVHIDGFQRRYNGDHNVLDGKYAMSFWRPGDIVVDDCEFALEPNFTEGQYTLYFGFFTGDTRFRVTKGPNHENRVIAGLLQVR